MVSRNQPADSLCLLISRIVLDSCQTGRCLANQEIGAVLVKHAVRCNAAHCRAFAETSHKKARTSILLAAVRKISYEAWRTDLLYREAEYVENPESIQPCLPAPS